MLQIFRNLIELIVQPLGITHMSAYGYYLSESRYVGVVDIHLHAGLYLEIDGNNASIVC